PNHVHALLLPLKGHSLSEILHSWKSFTGKELKRRTGKQEIVWQDENYDRIVRDEKELQHFRDYIECNPSNAGLHANGFILEVNRVLQMNHEASGETPDGPTGKMPVLAAVLLRAKKLGFSDRQLSIANGVSEKTVRSQRIAQNITPTYRLV